LPGTDLASAPDWTESFLGFARSRDPFTQRAPTTRDTNGWRAECSSLQSAQKLERAALEHRAQKWEPVLRKKRCDNKNIERAPSLTQDARSMFLAALRFAESPFPRFGAMP
jgi:hypothetical protein